MMERQPGAETVNDKLNSAYISFVDLVEKYGQPIDEGGIIFKKYITNPQDNSDDLISGRYFGPQSNTVQIFYRIGKEAADITLSKELSGKVFLSQFVVFDQQPTDKGNVLVQAQDANRTPNIDNLNKLLKRTRRICVEEKQRLKIRLDAAANLRKEHKERLKREREKKK
jgi:hypothetical protein